MRKLWREDALRSAYTMLNKRKKASKTDANAQPLCYYVSCNFDHISKRIWLAGVEAKNCYKDSLNNFKQIDIEIEIRRMPESLKDTCLSILFILNSPSRCLFQDTSDCLCNCDFMEYLLIMYSSQGFTNFIYKFFLSFKQLKWCCQLSLQCIRINKQ